MMLSYAGLNVMKIYLLCVEVTGYLCGGEAGDTREEVWGTSRHWPVLPGLGGGFMEASS